MAIIRGALRFAPVCPSVCLFVCLSVRSSRFTVKSMCNQLLSQFLMDLFETLHTYCGYIEDVHVGFFLKLELILTALQPFELSHFRQIFAL